MFLARLGDSLGSSWTWVSLTVLRPTSSPENWKMWCLCPVLTRYTCYSCWAFVLFAADLDFLLFHFFFKSVLLWNSTCHEGDVTAAWYYDRSHSGDAQLIFLSIKPLVFQLIEWAFNRKAKKWKRTNPRMDSVIFFTFHLFVPVHYLHIWIWIQLGRLQDKQISSFFIIMAYIFVLNALLFWLILSFME